MAVLNQCDRHNASVESRRYDKGRGGSYRPIRSRVRLLQRPQTREQDNFDSSQSSLESTFIVVRTAHFL